MQKVSKKIANEIQRAADLAFDNSSCSDILAQYTEVFTRRTMLYLDADAAFKYLVELQSIIDTLNGELNA